MSRDGITLVSTRIYPGDGPLFQGFVRISGGKIAAIGERHGVSQVTSQGDVILDAGDNVVIPGLIDLHIHGCGGHSADGGPAALQGMARFLALHGVTAFQPTLGAAPLAGMEVSIAAAGEYIRSVGAFHSSGPCLGAGQASGSDRSRDGDRGPGASCCAEATGLHLEGPFLSPLFPGAIPQECLIAPEIPLLEKWIELSGGSVSRVTLAPELPGALEAIGYMAGRGVSVGMGHTAAVYEEAVRGFQAGVKIVIHTFNAMRGFHHRDPGALGAALVRGGVFRELIADGIHVHPAAIELLVTSCGVDWVVLVSDAMPAAGLPPGRYEFMGRRVALDASGKVTLQDGTLAGSSALLVTCLRNMVESVGVPFAEALRMATVNPAKAAGLFDRKGSLTPGKDADIVILSDDYEVLGCWVRGRQVKNVLRERRVR